MSHAVTSIACQQRLIRKAAAWDSVRPVPQGAGRTGLRFALPLLYGKIGMNGGMMGPMKIMQLMSVVSIAGAPLLSITVNTTV